jgi:hypothetical protein
MAADKKSSMKRITSVMTVAFVVAAFTACEAPESEASKNVSKVTVYVDSIQGLTPEYTSENWTNLEKGYQERIMLMESEKEQLEAEDRARLEESIAKYDALKASYQENIRVADKAVANAVSDYKASLRNALFGEGVIGEDMSFGYVTGANLLDVYRRFVNTVDDNKNNYSREDWDEIKVLYEALDTRKNTVEKDAPNGDNTKIAGLKIKFGAIKGTHRGGTKGAENQEAKDKS